MLSLRKMCQPILTISKAVGGICARSRRKSLLRERRELDKAKLRVREIDRIIRKLYEDNATGKISDERFANDVDFA